MEDYDNMFKIVLVGDSGVGKSSLVLKYTDDVFNGNYISTIGVDFKIHNITVDDKKIKLQIWDTAGQERFKSITSSYYKGAHCIIFVCDITDMLSFNNLQTWINEMKHHTGDKYACIIGNKYDRVESYGSKREITKETAEEFAKGNNMAYTEVSAKTRYNIDNVFKRIARDLIKEHALLNTQQVKPVTLSTDESIFKKLCGC